MWPSPVSAFTLGSLWVKMDHASILRGSFLIFTTPDFACVSLSICSPSSSSGGQLKFDELRTSCGDEDAWVFAVSFTELLRLPALCLRNIPLLLLAFSRFMSTIDPFMLLRGEPALLPRLCDAEGGS